MCIRDRDNAQQKLVGDFINQKLLEVVPQPDKGKSAIKSALVESFMVLRSEWVREVHETVKPMTEPHAVTGEPVIVGEEAVPSMREGWTFRAKNPANMAWEPHTETAIQDSPWTRERAKMSYNELLAWQREGRIWNVEYLKNIVPSSLGASEKEDWEAKLKKADGDSEWNYTYADEKKYQIDEWYADLTFETQGQTQTVKCHFFIAEGSHLIYWEENPLQPKRHPYISCPILIDPRSITGLNILAPVEQLLEQINAYATKQSALVDGFSDPVVFYDESSGLNGRTTFKKMKGMIPVTNVNGIKEWVPDTSSLGVVRDYIQFLIGLARETTGANEQFQGIDGADTATEFQGLQAAAGSRFSDIADTLAQGMLEALAFECHAMYAQFGVDGEMVVHPSTESGPAQLITRAQLAGEYQFKAVSPVTEGYKGKQIADDTQFITEVGALNQAGAFGAKRYNLGKHIAEVSLPLRGVKTSADMFEDVPQMPMMAGPLDAPAGAAPMPDQMPPMPEGMA